MNSFFVPGFEYQAKKFCVTRSIACNKELNGIKFDGDWIVAMREILIFNFNRLVSDDAVSVYHFYDIIR